MIHRRSICSSSQRNICWRVGVEDSWRDVAADARCRAISCMARGRAGFVAWRETLRRRFTSASMGKTSARQRKCSIARMKLKLKCLYARDLKRRQKANILYREMCRNQSARGSCLAGNATSLNTQKARRRRLPSRDNPWRTN